MSLSQLKTLLLSPHSQTSTLLGYTIGPFMALAGSLKLIGWKAGHEQYQRAGHSDSVYYNTAVIEVIGSVMLLPEQTRFAGVVVLLGMIVFLETSKPNREGWGKGVKTPWYFWVPARVMTSGLVVLGWVARPWLLG
jgi:hypothetical protein